jgi:amidase
MKSQGAVLIDPANLPNMDNGTVFAELPTLVLDFEFKAGINAYLESLGTERRMKSLEDLIAFNEKNRDREMPFFGQERFLTSQARGPLTDPEYVKAVTTIQRMTRDEGIDALARQHQLDAIVAPTGGPAWLTDHILGDRLDGGFSAGPAAIAGYPDISVPMGFVSGLPVGVSFFGPAWTEPKLIAIAYSYEQATKHRKAPEFLPTLT